LHNSYSLYSILIIIGIGLATIMSTSGGPRRSSRRRAAPQDDTSLLNDMADDRDDTPTIPSRSIDNADIGRTQRSLRPQKEQSKTARDDINIRSDTQQQYPKGQSRPRAPTFDQNEIPVVVLHDRPIILNSGGLSSDRDIFCHGTCCERTIFATLDVTTGGNTYPMCPKCANPYVAKLTDVKLEELKQQYAEKGIQYSEESDYTDEYSTLRVVQDPIDVTIEVKGDKEEARKMITAYDLMIIYYTGLPNDNGQLDEEINNLKQKKIMLYEYGRGFLSSGLMWIPTRKIIEDGGQPLLKQLLDFLALRGRIQHGFIGHTLLEGDGIHPFHLDGWYYGDIRTVGSIGKSNKTMTIQNIKTGRWFTFKVPHGMLVTMTKFGGGVVGDTYAHRVDNCQGSYIIVVEQ
jgi:hypothetical protein